MTIPQKCTLAFCLTVLCFLGIIGMAYIYPFPKETIFNLLPMEISRIHKSNQNAMQTVVYLTDVAARDRENLLKNVSSIRTEPLKSLKVIGKMMESRLRDDYRFCRKEAPFVGPYNYTSKSKSPCWYSSRGHLSCVPYFYLAGFSKSGTTDLFYRITSEHPEISRDEKEIHWLEYIRYFENRDSIHTYASMFSKSTGKITSEIYINGHSNLIFGDGTPEYIWDSLHWPCYEGNRSLTEPKYTNADVIYRLNPQARIIVVLRDPVARLYSRYLMWINRTTLPIYKDPSPYSFHKIHSRAVELYTECFKEWSYRHCAYNGTLYVQSQTRLLEGMYSIFIRDWMKVFPRKQLFIMKFEDYVTDVPKYLRAIHRFLGVRQLSDKTIKRLSKLKTKNVGKHYDIGPMMEETKKMLQTFYAPFNKDLQNILNDASWAWGYEK